MDFPRPNMPQRMMSLANAFSGERLWTSFVSAFESFWACPSDGPALQFTAEPKIARLSLSLRLLKRRAGPRLPYAWGRRDGEKKCSLRNARTITDILADTCLAHLKF